VCTSVTQIHVVVVVVVVVIVVVVLVVLVLVLVLVRLLLLSFVLHPLGCSHRSWSVTVYLIRSLSLDEESTLSRSRYLHKTTRTQKKRRQISVLRVGFKPTNPVLEQAKIFH
jgi:hypothetical protein